MRGAGAPLFYLKPIAMKLFIFHLNLEHYPDRHWVNVVKAETLNEAKNILLYRENIDRQESHDDLLSMKELGYVISNTITVELDENVTKFNRKDILLDYDADILILLKVL